MTLTEYKNQENPVYMPEVRLKPGEFAKGFCYERYFGSVKKQVCWVHIEGYDFTYLAVEGEDRLYSSDADMNIKSLTCFYLPKK